MMNIKAMTVISVLCAISLQAVSLAADKPAVGESLKLGEYAESAAETQKLIDARPDMQRPMEKLGRGGVAVRMDGYTYLSWRWLGTESADTKFNIYGVNGEERDLLNAEPISSTNYSVLGNGYDHFYVAAVKDGVETEYEPSQIISLWDKNYMDIPIEKPDDNEVNGEKYSYSPADASVGDLDGDGEWEIVLKWDPSNAKDTSQAGFTGECLIDAYKLDGTRLWRINLGPNIRSGAHDTQFMVYDYDCDGKAEIAMRTADGTVAGDGSVIGDKNKNYAVLDNGKNLSGPLYLTVFRGADGSVIDTTEYYPQTQGVTDDGYEWDVITWGDWHEDPRQEWGNRCERYLACVAYLDGVRPSMVFARGYYYGPGGDIGGRTTISAYDLIDGKLEKHWFFDTLDKEYRDNKKLIGQGNHSMSVADVDYDGCDEIIYGSLAVDNDGTPLYSTGLGHGDAQHVSDLDPSRPGLEVYSCHEDGNVDYGYEMRDARTGEVLYGRHTGFDNGRAAAGDVDPRYPGAEGWSSAGVLTKADGTVISDNYTMPANFLCYWDGDTGREILDNIYVSKWNPIEEKAETIFTASGCTSINWTKATPSLSADLFGDWREELMFPTKDGSALRIFTTTDQTAYKVPTLMHDIQYRMHIAYQNTCYNQPPHLSYYLGYETESVPVPQIYTVGDNARNPDLKGGTSRWSVDKLYTGERVELAVGVPTAIVNGTPVRIDNDNTEVVPVIDENDRTLVPLRFIAEAFGCEVKWDGEQQKVYIYNKKHPHDMFNALMKDMGNDLTFGESFPYYDPNLCDYIVMTIGKTDYTAYAYEGQTADPHGKLADLFSTFGKTMDTAPVIENDRTLVPLRAVTESILKNVYWNDGLITVSDVEEAFSDKTAAARLAEIKNAPVPKKIERVAINGTGEKYYNNQLDVYGVSSSDNDGNKEDGAVDLDIKTRWSASGANTLTIDLGDTPVDVTGVAIAMWKGAERTYPFVIEYSADGQTWQTALPKTQNTGESEEFEKYMFPQPVTARYIRYSGDGDTVPGKNCLPYQRNSRSRCWRRLIFYIIQGGILHEKAYKPDYRIYHAVTNCICGGYG